ncbi:MAG: imidazole glycerol-phosphate synthase subunit HisH, partial [Thermodesulfobacteriota bacterium]|nr:imidazole glycerol-phosphate synthase subunit HisH [Thermodesulfobacteriota bacterium]
MIVIVDYGMGNLRSVQKGFEKIGTPALISRQLHDIDRADHLVLPGVGAFPECMRNLDVLGLIQPIRNFLDSGKPFLGICLGLQLLFDESEEFGVHQGFGIIPGRVRAFDRNMGLKIPHMGWNQVSVKRTSPLFDGIADGTYFYFVHSYYVDPNNVSDVLTETDYGITFTSSVSRHNVFA